MVKRRSRPVPKRARRDIEGEIHARRKALADLMHSQVLGQGDVNQAFKQITETASQVLEVERASVWRLADSGAAIECIDLFERSPGRHSSGVRIEASDVPRYFAALQRERAIRAHDARTDKRTSEFRKGYLVPLGHHVDARRARVPAGQDGGRRLPRAHGPGAALEAARGVAGQLVRGLRRAGAGDRGLARGRELAARRARRAGDQGRASARAICRRASRTCARWSTSRRSRWC